MVRRILSAGCVTASAIIVSSCWAARGAAEDRRCEPVQGELPVGLSAVGLAGTYRVLLVGTGGEARGKQLRGNLTLVPHDSSRQRFFSFFGRVNPSLRLPLYGQLDADLARLGAIVPGRSDGADPDRPGVEVRQVDAVYQDRPFTEITLLVGDEGNRRDQITLDGAHFGMRVQHMAATEFRGAWRSSVGMTTFDASGHYCAWRVSHPPAG